MRRLLKRGVCFKLTVTTTDKIQIIVHSSTVYQCDDNSTLIVLYQCARRHLGEQCFHNWLR